MSKFRKEELCNRKLWCIMNWNIRKSKCSNMTLYMVSVGMASLLLLHVLLYLFDHLLIRQPSEKRYRRMCNTTYAQANLISIVGLGRTSSRLNANLACLGHSVHTHRKIRLCAVRIFIETVASWRTSYYITDRLKIISG